MIAPIANSTSPSSPPAIITPNPQTTVTPTPPLSSLPPEQIKAIVDQAAAAVLSAINSSRKCQPTRTTEVLESHTSHPNDMFVENLQFSLFQISCSQGILNAS